MADAVRLAVTTDLPRLIALDTKADPRRVHEITQAVGDNLCWVYDDGDIKGYATLHRHFFDQPFMGLLIVAANARRQGVGAKLVHAVADSVKTSGKKLFTSTNQSNLPMQGLLKKLGFVPSGRVEGLDDGDPEMFFLKLLD